jgi:hypothetical protein
MRCHSVDSFGPRRWYSYGSQDTLQNLWDTTVGTTRGQRSDFEYSDTSHPEETERVSWRNQDSFERPDGEDGDGFLESKSDINTPVPTPEEYAERFPAKSLFALAAKPSAAVLFDFEEQVRQTATFEAAAIAALKTSYSVRSSNSNDGASQSPPPTLVLSSTASLTSLFAPIADESLPVGPNKSPTSDRPPDRVMLRRPAVLHIAPSVDSASSTATRTIQLTAHETVKEDQLNAYLRWLQTQHSASEGDLNSSDF